MIERVWHPWTRWECYPAGFYDTVPPDGMSPDDARGLYRDFLSDVVRFHRAMDRVAREWPVSCEHFLTNTSSNRLAWLGQAAMCVATGVPSVFRGGFRLLDSAGQRAANHAAARFLLGWEREYIKAREVHLAVEGTWLPGRHSRRSTRRLDAPAVGAIVQGDMFGGAEE